MDGRPPTVTPEPSGVHAARGAVRDSLSAIRNLAQLLGSVRVGPKALGNVIPDVHAACEPMLRSTRYLLSAESNLGDPESRRALLDYLEPRMLRLDAALAASHHRAFRASQRLALEKVAVRIVPELDGALGLVDCLMEAVHDRRVNVDVTEMARESATILEGTHLPHREMRVALEPATSPVTVAVNARATMALLTLGVSVAATSPDVPVTVRIAADGDACRLDIAPTLDAQATFGFVVPEAIGPTSICAAALARAVGIEFSQEGGRVLLRLPIAD